MNKIAINSAATHLKLKESHKPVSCCTNQNEIEKKESENEQKKNCVARKFEIENENEHSKHGAAKKAQLRKIHREFRAIGKKNVGNSPC